MFFWAVGSNPTTHHVKLLQTLYMSNLKLLSPIPRGNETAWILTRPPVHSAGLLSRRFYPAVSEGEECLYGLVWVSYWLTFFKWSNGLIPH